MNSLGVDLGSHYTKIAVCDDEGSLLDRRLLPTLCRNRDALEQTLAEVKAQFDWESACATGYGRSSVPIAMKRPELICAASGVSREFSQAKTIVDIGGEDIKIIETALGGRVEKFFMNDKCSAGTGAFLTEISERAEISLEEMNSLALQSRSTRAMNSFCTVFAKTEILSWKFDGATPADMARGIYLSVVDRVCKLPVRNDLPVVLCGGVAAYHPLLATLLSERLGADVFISCEPQFMVAYGAALLARDSAC